MNDDEELNSREIKRNYLKAASIQNIDFQVHMFCARRFFGWQS